MSQKPMHKTISVFSLLTFCFLLWGCKAHSNSTETKSSQASSELSAAPNKERESPGEQKLSNFVNFETEQENKIWLGLLNDLLSPCGEPISLSKCIQQNASCSSCVPAAKYLGRLINEAYDTEEAKAFFQLRYSKETFLELDLTKAPIRGSTLAPVTIVVFSDFQCPFCAATHPKLQRILESHKGKVRIAFKHYPLPAHPRAISAAKAAIAAGNQGKFWQMHDLLFENNLSLEDVDLISFAKQLQLNVDQFKKDLDAAHTLKQIDTDKEEGNKVGVEGTPTILVNGRHFAEPIEALPAYIREELL